MPRRRRIQVPDAIHHITIRAPARREMFRDDHDRDRYLELLGHEIRERSWSLFSYCLMTTHAHLLLRSPAGDFGDGFKVAHEQYAVEFNRRADEHGTLISNGPRYTLVESERHFFATLRYVARNPVEAGICVTPAAWPWSAHRALLGHVPTPDLLDVDGLADLLGGVGRMRSSYASLSAMDDVSLLMDLRSSSPATWIADAIDVFRMSIPTVRTVAGGSERTVYRRLAEQRELVAGKGRAWS